MDFIPKQRCGHCAKLIASCGIRADDRFSRGMLHIVNIELSAPVFDQAFGRCSSFAALTASGNSDFEGGSRSKTISVGWAVSTV